MKIGMLWFDNDPKADLKIKIERAASYYSKKYGQSPNLCFIHPSMGSGEKPNSAPEGFNPTQSEGTPEPNGHGNGNGNGHGKAQAGPANIEIRTNRSVLPNHFWIGISENQPG
jgi:hypothetical protein